MQAGVYTLANEIMANPLTGGPVKPLPPGTKILVIPRPEDPSIVAAMREAGLSGEVYVVVVMDTALTFSPKGYMVVGEQLNKGIKP